MVKTLILSLFVSTATFGQEAVKSVDKTIFVYGGDFNKVFINYVIGLTKKPNPKIFIQQQFPANGSQNSATTPIRERFESCCGNSLRT